jgi:uncharacterized membrane protein
VQGIIITETLVQAVRAVLAAVVRVVQAKVTVIPERQTLAVLAAVLQHILLGADLAETAAQVL